MNEEIRRVLLELSIDAQGRLDLRLDREMKPITILAVMSATDILKEELKELLVGQEYDE